MDFMDLLNMKNNAQMAHKETFVFGNKTLKSSLPKLLVNKFF